MASVKIYKNIPLTRDGVARIKCSPIDLVSQLDDYQVFSYEVSYVKGGVIEIPTVALNLDGCNYLSYNNGGTIEHFAFIDDVIWTSHGSCAISFSEDYFTSYAWRVSLGRGKLNQTNSANVDSNTYQLRRGGDYVPKHFTPLTVSNSLNIKISEWGYIIGLANPLNIVYEAVLLERRVSTLATTGYWLYCKNATELYYLTTKFDFNPLVSEDDILGIYAIPKFIGDELPLTDLAFGDPVIDSLGYKIRFINKETSPIEWEYDIVSQSIKGNKRYSDLWRSPYTYVDVQLLGEHYTYSPEELSDDISTVGSVKLRFGLTAKPCITLILEGLRTTTTYNPITLGTVNLPEVPFTVTQVSGWATGQGLLNIAQNVASSGSVLDGAVKGIVSNPMRTGVKNSGSIPTAQQTTGDSRIWVKVIIPTPLEVIAIWDDLERYGFNYDVNTPIDLDAIWEGDGSVGWDSKTVPLYLRCEDVSINGEISHNALLTIRDALQSGVRIYTNIDELKEGE